MSENVNASAPAQKVAAYMRTPEAAAYLGVCPKTVATLVKRRILPAIHLSKRLVLFRRTDLDEALNRLRFTALNE